VASALTAEIIFEIMKCMSDVDMRGRVRMGSKSEIFMFFMFFMFFYRRKYFDFSTSGIDSNWKHVN